MDNRIDDYGIVIGEVYGDKRVLEFMRDERSKYKRWSFRCECIKCRRQSFVRPKSLKNGRQNNCEYCYHNRVPEEDLSARLAETDICPNCGKLFLIWRVYKNKRNGRNKYQRKRSTNCQHLCGIHKHADDHNLFSETLKPGGNNIYSTAFGETKNLAQWARDPRCVVSYRTLLIRVRDRGWDLEKAITIRLKKKSKPNLNLEALLTPLIQPITTGTL